MLIYTNPKLLNRYHANKKNFFQASIRHLDTVESHLKTRIRTQYRACVEMIFQSILKKYLRRHFSVSSSHYGRVDIPVQPLKLHKLPEEMFPKTGSISVEEARTYLSEMWMIRQMEGECSRLYKEKSIRGFCHLFSGQEACGVGMKAALLPDDSLITSYRSHAWTYLKGQSVASIICELTGRLNGCSKGKGGSMHTYAPEFYGGNGIVGAQVPMGAGVALAHKLRNNGRICAALYGDGAANQGQVFESFNMAALWKLPVIFVCENNQYGMGTSTSRSSASDLYYTRGDFIPGVRVQGECVVSVREATKVVADYVRSGKGPIVLELFTYRFFGHSMSDPGTSYRTTDELQKYRKEYDPIKIFTEQVLTENLLTEAEIESIKSKATEEADEAAELAVTSPFTPESELATNIYVGEYAPVRGCDPFTFY